MASRPACGDDVVLFKTEFCQPTPFLHFKYAATCHRCYYICIASRWYTNGWMHFVVLTFIYTDCWTQLRSTQAAIRNIWAGRSPWIMVTLTMRKNASRTHSLPFRVAYHRRRCRWWLCIFRTQFTYPNTIGCIDTSNSSTTHYVVDGYVCHTRVYIYMYIYMWSRHIGNVRQSLPNDVWWLSVQNAQQSIMWIWKTVVMRNGRSSTHRRTSRWRPIFEIHWENF